MIFQHTGVGWSREPARLSQKTKTLEYQKYLLTLDEGFMQNFSLLSWKQKIRRPFDVLVVILVLWKAWKWPKSEILYLLS